MILLTYGNMPTFEQFTRRFARETRPDNVYHITLSTSDARALAETPGCPDGFELTDGAFSVSYLWSALNEIVDHWRTDTMDEAGPYQDQRVDIVSSILSTLGFEWI
jgi:hypothetical protein